MRCRVLILCTFHLLQFSEFCGLLEEPREQREDEPRGERIICSEGDTNGRTLQQETLGSEGHPSLGNGVLLISLSSQLTDHISVHSSGLGSLYHCCGGTG